MTHIPTDPIRSEEIRIQSDARAYSANLLTQARKTEESIEAAKENVDANEK